MRRVRAQDAFQKAAICIAATLLAAAFLAFPKGAARADDEPLAEAPVADVGTGSAHLSLSQREGPSATRAANSDFALNLVQVIGTR
jgi:hypothetical protein